MGRAGGGGGFSGGGGGSFGGGFSGGSHHTGGFSGGGHSSRSTGSGRATGGPRPSYSSGPRPGGPRPGGPRPGGPHPGGPIPGGYYGGPRPPRRTYRRTSGPVASSSASASSVILTVLILVFIFALIGTTGAFADVESGDITASSVQREKINSAEHVLTDYYTDEAGYIHSSRTLEKGMKEFYEETGVQPYLYITDNVNGDATPDAAAVEAKCQELYDAIMPDESHFFILFVDSPELEDMGQDFVAQYEVGNVARTVMDDEACDIVCDYIKACYYDSEYSDWEDFFSAAYSKSADRLMTVTVDQVALQKEKSKTAFYYVTGIAGIGALGCGAYKWWDKKKQRDKEEAERTERILNTPLETFASKENNDAAAELSKKYEDTDKSQETTGV